MVEIPQNIIDEYYDYFADCSDVMVHPLSLEQFAALSKLSPLQHTSLIKEMSKSSSNRDLDAIGLPGSIASGIFDDPNLRRVVGVAAGAAGMKARDMAAKAANRMADNIDNGAPPWEGVFKRPGRTGGGKTPNFNADGSVEHPFDPRRQNFGVKPTESSFNSGIIPKTFGDFFMECRASWSSLDLTFCRFQWPSGTTSTFQRFFDDCVIFNFQNEAQGSVSFNVNATNAFSKTNVYKWLDAWTNAYSAYVFLTSIIACTNLPGQHNSGLKAIRSAITPDILDGLSRLENMLQGTPCPPKLAQLLHWTFTVYSSSSNPGSVLRAICPFQFYWDGNTASRTFMISPGLLDVYIDELFLSRETTALMARVRPTWIPNGNLVAGNEAPKHNLNYNTLWKNLPGYYRVGAQPEQIVPAVADANTDACYSSSADILDGAITAMFTAYDLSVTTTPILTTLRPGLMFPIPVLINSAVIGNRLSFFGADQGWVSPHSNSGLAYNRGETHTITPNGVDVPFIQNGDDFINNVNINTTRESAYELITSLLSMSATSSPKKPDRKRRGKKTK